MSEITVSFSDKITVRGRQPWASVTITRTIDDEMCEHPLVVAEFVRSLQDKVESAVLAHLERQLPEADESDVPAPIAARMTAPPAARPALPAPVSPSPNSGASRRYYDNRRESARSNDGPPTSGKTLFGWAKDHDCVAWFTALSKAQKPPLPRLLSDVSDEWAVWLFAQYEAACAATPPPPSTNGNGRH